MNPDWPIEAAVVVWLAIVVIAAYIGARRNTHPF